jgi:hypothetical protein
MIRIVAALLLAVVLVPGPAFSAVAYSVADCRSMNQSLSGVGEGGSLGFLPDWFSAISYHFHQDLRGVVSFRHAYSTGGQYASNVVAGDSGDWGVGYWGNGPWLVSGIHGRYNATVSFWYTYATSWSTDCSGLNPWWTWWWPAPTNRQLWSCVYC